MKILALGDVVSEGGLYTLCEKLPLLKKETGADFVIVNGENASMGKGNGISASDAEALLQAGVDVITGGNHSFRQKSICRFLDDHFNVLRPANFPKSNPGTGYAVIPFNGIHILCINVMGRVNMDPVDCPFKTCDEILEMEKGNFDIAAVDFHAEATSEKFALASYLDGRVQIFFGTHTHVPTADEQILEKGCGYITDLGMCGPSSSALGVRTDIIINKLKTGMPCKFEPSQNPSVLEGALFTLSDFDFHCQAVERIFRK